MQELIKNYTLPPAMAVEAFTPPAAMPRMGNRFTRWLGSRLMALIGWKVAGELPNHSKLVIAGAPHTSNWDFVVAMFLVMALGVKFSYLMKKEAFIWPFKGLFMALGGIPIDRSRGDQVMVQMKTWFANNDHCWVAITPEGTRSQVEKFKTGFLRIAEAAEVPVLLVAWHYPKKTFYICPLANLSGDINEDVAAIKTFYDTHFVGRNP
ncbi:1-acyl-sn-glycerol-3-phosphate acyltransferase [Halioxenophilus sp. WMMB6]|uniref:1-acyl-sn-glycerol-3-phosphate acyltransferase n=1 Tax=Halioxenophilus sp. WMMB6 TaxID=3073815 RepID=UPI00295E33B2|nr:1-acyl-sn-glycerol-3-phosphate acyltransferase [Halioxenophilus sp. WMMB6]